MGSFGDFKCEIVEEAELRFILVEGLELSTYLDGPIKVRREYYGRTRRAVENMRVVVTALYASARECDPEGQMPSKLDWCFKNESFEFND